MQRLNIVRHKARRHFRNNETIYPRNKISDLEMKSYARTSEAYIEWNMWI
jgi:hypothetical protein